MREEISAVLLHQPAESQRLLKQALEDRSIKVNWLQNYRETLPLLREATPPHLVFTEALLLEPPAAAELLLFAAR